MRKLLFLVGLGAGYVLGARAGREPYDKLAAAANRAWESPRVAKARREVEAYARTQAPIIAERAEAIAKAAPGVIADGAQKAAEAAADAAGRATNVAHDLADRTTVIAKDVAGRTTVVAKDVKGRTTVIAGKASSAAHELADKAADVAGTVAGTVTGSVTAKVRKTPAVPSGTTDSAS